MRFPRNIRKRIIFHSPSFKCAVGQVLLSSVQNKKTMAANIESPCCFWYTSWFSTTVSEKYVPRSHTCFEADLTVHISCTLGTKRFKSIVEVKRRDEIGRKFFDWLSGQIEMERKLRVSSDQSLLVLRTKILACTSLGRFIILFV